MKVDLNVKDLIKGCDPAELGEEIGNSFEAYDVGTCINHMLIMRSLPAVIDTNMEKIVSQLCDFQKKHLKEALYAEEEEKPIEEETFYKVGDKFKTDDGTYLLTGDYGTYLLSACGYYESCNLGLIKVERVCGACIGKVWSGELCIVRDIFKITKEEFDHISGGQSEKFTLIK